MAATAAPRLYSDTPLCPSTGVVPHKSWQWYYSLLMNYDTLNVFSTSEDYYSQRDRSSAGLRLVFHGFDDVIPYRGLKLTIILGL